MREEPTRTGTATPTTHDTRRPPMMCAHRTVRETSPAVKMVPTDTHAHAPVSMHTNSTIAIRYGGKFMCRT